MFLLMNATLSFREMQGMGNETVALVQWIVYVPTFTAGLPLNLAALWLMVFRIRNWTVSTVYLTSLVINDSLLIFSLPFKIYAFNNPWGLGRGFCAFLESLVFVNIYGSIILTVCISGDRFVSLQFPFRSRQLRSCKKAVLVSVAVWVVVLAFTTPVYNFHSGDGNAYCFQGFSEGTWNNLWLIVTMEMVFLLSTVAMLFFSVRVVQILRALRRRNPMDEKLRDSKSVKIVLSNLAAFLVCFIPYHAVALVYFLAKYRGASRGIINPLRIVVHISTCMSSVNCLTDGICYYLILKESLQSARNERRRMSTRGDLQVVAMGTTS